MEYFFNKVKEFFLLLKDFPWPAFLFISMAWGYSGWSKYGDSIRSNLDTKDKVIEANDGEIKALKKYSTLQEQVTHKQHSDSLTLNNQQ